MSRSGSCPLYSDECEGDLCEIECADKLQSLNSNNGDIINDLQSKLAALQSENTQLKLSIEKAVKYIKKTCSNCNHFRPKETPSCTVGGCESLENPDRWEFIGLEGKQ